MDGENYYGILRDIIAFVGATSGIWAIFANRRKVRASALRDESEAYAIMIKPLQDEIKKQKCEIEKLEIRVNNLENELKKEMGLTKILRAQLIKLKQVPEA